MDIIPRTQYDQPNIKYPDDYSPSLNGIGGFLILVIIGRIISIIYGIKDIADLIPLIGIDSSVDLIVYPALAVDIIFSITLSIIILVFIFMRKIIFRTLFVIQVTVAFAFVLALDLYMNGLGYDIGYSNLIIPVIGGLIWITYMYKSQRVKNTYIYPKLYPNAPANKEVINS